MFLIKKKSFFFDRVKPFLKKTQIHILHRKFLLFYFRMLFSALYLKPAEEKAMLDILVVKSYKCSHFNFHGPL